MKIVFPVILLIALIVVGGSSFFILDEGKQAVITQFGRPVGKPITNAGLHFKKPFLHEVRYIDKRILTWDGFPNQVPTKDKKYISVDTTARWRIIDALKFIQTVQNERGAKARLDSILDAITRDTISNNKLVEVVRNTNSIIKKLEDFKKKSQQQILEGKKLVDEEVTGEIDKINSGREKLSEIISERADKELRSFGISIVDVQFRRISYEKSVEQKVYERMISERERIAEQLRSIGKGEKAKIEGRLSRDLQKIESRAYRESQRIRGQAEGKAAKIYATAYSRDPKFYEFIKTMDSYKKSLKAETHFILSSGSDFLKMLQDAK